MSKHTSGPWFVKKCDWCEEGFACAITSKSSDKYYDATVLGSDNRDECTHIMTKADANLIAAAPELLETLKEVYTYLDKPHKSEYGNVEIISLTHQAIAKAEGGK